MRAAPSIVSALAFATTVFGASPTSWGFFRLAGDGSVGISGVDVVVIQQGHETAWILAAQLTGPSTARFALVTHLPPNAKVELLGDVDLLDRLEQEAGPNAEIVEAADPCVAGTELRGRREAPRRKLLEGLKARKPAIPQAQIFELEEEDLLQALARQGVPHQGATLPRPPKSRRATRTYLVIGTPPKSARVFRAPPLLVRFSGPEWTLPIGNAAPDTPLGQTQIVRVLTIAEGFALVPSGIPMTALPDAIDLPEVTLEDPTDLERAISTHAIRRAASNAALLQHAGPVSSEGAARLVKLGFSVRSGFVTVHRLEHGRGRAPYSVAFAKVDPVPFQPVWRFTRLWRKPIECSEKGRYLNNARIQQMAELRNYATVTGRPLVEIQQLSQRRGYAQRSDGSLAPVRRPKHKRPHP